MGIVGPSGSGKSSIIQLLLRFYDPQEGTILLDGRDIKTIPARRLRERMGWVQQEAPLFADSIAYNIAYGRKSTKAEAGKGAPREMEEDTTTTTTTTTFNPNVSLSFDEDVKFAAREANMYEYLERFKYGLSTFVGDRGSSLSGGQKQRGI